MRTGVEKSLKRLQLENVDILYYHKCADDLPLKKQVSVMNEMIENKKTYYWDTGKYPPEIISKIFKICEKFGFIPPI